MLCLKQKTMEEIVYLKDKFYYMIIYIINYSLKEKVYYLIF